MTSSKLADRRGGGGSRRRRPPPRRHSARRRPRPSRLPVAVGRRGGDAWRRSRRRRHGASRPATRAATVRRSPGDAQSLAPARARLPVALSGDRRRVVPRPVRGGAPPGAPRGSEKRRRGGLASLALSRHDFRFRPSGAGAGALALAPKRPGPTASSAMPSSSFGATTRPSAPSTRWLGSGPTSPPTRASPTAVS